jgi:hypothetical protein
MPIRLPDQTLLCLSGKTHPEVGGAPIGSGVLILIALALVYGINRWYALKKVKAMQE